MGERLLTDAELRAAAASRPGYATYPQYRPGQPERLAPYWRGEPAPSPAVPVPTAAPRWYDHADIWGPETEPAAAATSQPDFILRAARELSEDEAEQIKRSFEEKVAEHGLRLAVLPPSPVFEFSPQRSPGRPWWRRRWNWAVMSGDGRSWWGYCWTLTGARRRTARARRAAR